MKKNHILIVEDDEDIQQLVSFNLLKAGFHVSCANSGEMGLQLLEAERIDCLLLDIMLPGKDGLEICHQIRENEQFSTLPIIMLTAKQEENEIVAGLELGADDYVTKPFSPKELIARVKALLRRHPKESTESPPESDKPIIIRNLKLFPGRHEIFVDDQKIHLTATEFSILAMLVRKPGWAFTRQQIIDTVRGHGYTVSSRMIDVQVFSLRKKLGEAGKYIETVRSVGYRFLD